MYNPHPFATGYLDEQDGHKVYYEQYGNKEAETVLVFHGGPGAKSKSKHVKGYELDKYHIILFDQRGCGKSLPLGEISHNTTAELIADAERIRESLGISNWFVAGSSWGFTLALAYAEKYPGATKGLLLGSGFLGRVRDDEWAFSKSDGINRIFPDLWDKRVEWLKKYDANAQSAAKVLLKDLQSSDSERMKDIAAGVMSWEGNLMNAQEDIHITEPNDVEDEDVAGVKIFLHYQANNFFLENDQILRDLNRIVNIPTVIVHGRYDLLCPAEQIWEVSKKLKQVETIILPTSNHRLTADGVYARSIAFNYFLHKHTH